MMPPPRAPSHNHPPSHRLTHSVLLPCLCPAALPCPAGAVGQEFLRVLHERDFPYSDIVMLASERSAGRTYTFEGNEYTVQALTDKRCARNGAWCF